MKISDKLKKEAILLEMKAAGKEEAIHELVDLLCSAYRLGDRDEILAAIENREARQSTGIGMGLAVPHAKTPVVNRLYIAFGRSSTGIDFDSIDGEAARIFFILVSPRDVSGPHIKALAGISRLVKHEELRRALLDCTSGKKMLEIIREAEKRYL